MTLEEYEKVLSEKRKALEALKSKERKVTLDKDFEAMQLIERKNEEVFAKLVRHGQNLGFVNQEQCKRESIPGRIELLPCSTHATRWQQLVRHFENCCILRCF
jgi:hypothetical protein